MRVKDVITASRMPFVTASLLPVFWTIAWIYVYEGKFSLLHSLLVVLGVLFLHLGANTINDYIDWDSSDRINKNVTPFSGGSRQRMEKTMKKKHFLLLSILFFSLALLMGGLLFFFDRPAVFLIGVVGGILGMFYSVPPFSFMKRGLGEFVIFLAFGPVLTLGTGYAITGVFSTYYAYIGIPMGLLVTAILWINEFPDYEADKLSGKNTLVVILGKKVSVCVYLSLFIFVILSVLLLIYFKLLPLWSLLVILTVPLFLKAYSILSSNAEEPKKLVPAQDLTIKIQTISSVLLILSVIFYGFMN